jgi:hypothetical protein
MLRADLRRELRPYVLPEVRYVEGLFFALPTLA